MPEVRLLRRRRGVCNPDFAHVLEAAARIISPAPHAWRSATRQAGKQTLTDENRCRNRSISSSSYSSRSCTSDRPSSSRAGSRLSVDAPNAGPASTTLNSSASDESESEAASAASDGEEPLGLGGNCGGVTSRKGEEPEEPDSAGEGGPEARVRGGRGGGRGGARNPGCGLAGDDVETFGLGGSAGG